MALYIVPTPIGNLGDITLRALETLRQSDAIVCEDTRRTLKLLNRYEIRKPLISLHRHNEKERMGVLIERLEDGIDLALVSDAGTPGISDPGSMLIREAISRGIDVEALPGPSAILPALILSGLDTSSFLFAGFIDGSEKGKTEKVIALSQVGSTLVFYVAPHDLSKRLKLISQVLGDRRAAVVREISKVHEEVLRGSLSELKEAADARELKGEIVLVVEGRRKGGKDEEACVWQKLAKNMKSEGISDRTIANVLFASYGIPRNNAKKFIASQRQLQDAGTADETSRR